MSKHRSPNCPQIPFREALVKARPVYDEEHTHPSPRLVIANDLGYTGLSGRAVSTLGALRQYGILDGSGDSLRISKDAVICYEMDDSREKREAMQRMAFAPALFHELREQYGDTLPGDGNLRHQLVTKGFSSASAEDVIQVYKANVEHVFEKDPGYNQEESTIEEDQPVTPTATATAESIKEVQAGSHAWTWTLSVPRSVNAQLTIAGNVTKADIGRLRKQIEFLEESFDETEETAN